MIENYNELVLDVEVEAGTVFEGMDEKVKQIPSAANANYEVLFSETPDNEEHIEFAKKSNHLTYNPSTGNLNIVKINGSTVGSNPKFTDTTYEDATEETHGLMSTADKIKLGGIEGGAQVNVQSDWAENDDTADDYIKNKPSINDNEITIQLNGTDIDSFTLNQDTDKTVNIVITKDDVGLDQADNTSDLDKPISTATQTALDNKVDIVSGKGLSTEDYTTEEKNKLEGISSGAEVNQNAFSNIKVGNSTISADSETDTFELIAGSDITITPDATNDTVTIASKVYTPASSVVDIDTTGAVGVSENYARADHTHKISVATGDNEGQVKIAGANATVNGLGTAAFKNVSNTYSSSGTDPVSGQAVAQAIDEIPNPMVFRGSLGVGGTITTLPTDGSANVGDTYKVITDGTYDGQSAQIGDIFICKTKTNDSNTWELIPSGDEPSGTVTSIKLQATTPILVDDDSAITTSGTRTFSHANSGVTADSYGDTTGQTPAFGDTFKVPSATVNATGHITEMAEHTVTIPSTTATTETAGLMSSTDKSKLNGIEDNANNTIVDSSLSDSSTNPVQNKIVTEALDTKANDEGSYPDFIAGYLSISDDVKGANTDPYIYRPTPQYPNMGKFAKMHKIVGASVVWNQLVQNGNFADTSNWAVGSGLSNMSCANNTATVTFDSTINVNNHIAQNFPMYANHKYLLTADISSTAITTYKFSIKDTGGTHANTSGSNIRVVYSQEITDTNAQITVGFINSYAEGTGTIKNVMCIDLTTMFGTTIADYVYTLETAEAGSGIAWLQSYGFFTEDYYAYKQNKLESGCVSAHKTYDGETLLTNTELSPITLRGLLGLSDGKLTVNGDEYNASGTVNRKYGTETYDGSSDESWNVEQSGTTYRFKHTIEGAYSENGQRTPLICDKAIYISSGNAVGGAFIYGANNSAILYLIIDQSITTIEAFRTYLASNPLSVIYELATPTTEQTTPFTETEIVGSTEEFIDYEVAQDNRDVAIPVGTETDYLGPGSHYLDVPPLPSSDGTYFYGNKTESGEYTQDWIKSEAYTSDEKTKLSGIAAEAEVNQNAYSTIKVGETDVSANSKTDVLELVAGNNVTLTPDATNKKVTLDVPNEVDRAKVSFSLLSSKIDENAPYIYRQSGGDVKEAVLCEDNLVGASVVWNQLVQDFASNKWSSRRGTISVSDDVLTYTITEIGATGTQNGLNYTNINLPVNHCYLVNYDIYTPHNSTTTLLTIKTPSTSITSNSKSVTTGWNNAKFVCKPTDYDIDALWFCLDCRSGFEVNEEIKFKNVYCTDLTAMFGATIADYVSTLEQSEAGTGIAWLQSYGFFTEEYYAYQTNKIESGCVSGKKICGKNLFDKTTGFLNGYLGNTGAYTTSSQENANACVVVRCFAGQTYTVSKIAGARFKVACFEHIPLNGDKGTDATYNDTASSITVTPSANARYLVAFVWNKNNDEANISISDMLDSVQIEIGSTATSYEPYASTTCPLSPITLRGLYTLATNKLVANGDIYNADGSANKKYGFATFDGSNDEDWTVNMSSEIYRWTINISDALHTQGYRTFVLANNLTYASSGSNVGTTFMYGETDGLGYLYIVVDQTITTVEALRTYLTNTPLEVQYELETPVAEQATPYPTPQFIDKSGTEEYIDYQVAQGNRDVAIPIGGNRKYRQGMELPELPTASGDHNLQFNPATGFSWS